MSSELVLKGRNIADENKVCSTYQDGETIIQVENIFIDEISLTDAIYAALSSTKFIKE